MAKLLPILLFFCVSMGYSQVRNKPFAVYSTIGLKAGAGVTSFYNSNYKNYSSLVFGFGMHIQKFVISLKQTYSLSSLTEFDANPIKDGYYNNTDINNAYANAYKTNMPTNLYTAQITIEYYLPFIKFKRYWRGKKEISVFQKVYPPIIGAKICSNLGVFSEKIIKTTCAKVCLIKTCFLFGQ